MHVIAPGRPLPYPLTIPKPHWTGTFRRVADDCNVCECTSSRTEFRRNDETEQAQGDGRLASGRLLWGARSQYARYVLSVHYVS